MDRLLLGIFLAALASGCATPVAAPGIMWAPGDSCAVSFRGTLPVIDASVANANRRKSAKLVLDTGCEGVALSTSLVAALQLPALHKLVRYEGEPVDKGGVGDGRSVTYGVGWVDVPGCFVLQGGEAIGVKMPGEIDALAGLSAFPDRAVVLDAPQKRVYFVTRDVADQLCAVEGCVAMPAHRVRNTLRVQVTIASLKADFLVDTGARYSWISPTIARGAAVNGTIQGRLRSGQADLGLRVLRVESDGRLAGSIGSDVLLGLGRAVLLDLESERVVLLPVLGPQVR